jgi:hypothetical protein
MPAIPTASSSPASQAAARDRMASEMAIWRRLPEVVRRTPGVTRLRRPGQT